MGLMNNILGVGHVLGTVGNVMKNTSEVFHVNETAQMSANAEQFQSAMDQFQSEFINAPQGWFSVLIDGLNRLPRPMMALGTIGLFIYAMADPQGFSTRMNGLALIPEPLWWLLGAIVGFYFGARELHHYRSGKTMANPTASMMNMAALQKPIELGSVIPAAPTANPELAQATDLSNIATTSKTRDNAAILEWKNLQG